MGFSDWHEGPPRCDVLRIAFALCILASGFVGCASFKQVQYFSVVGEPDPTTGIAPTEYYRMTLQGTGTGFKKYQMRAAYLSAAAVDALNGRVPFLPIADMDPKSRAAFELNKDLYLAAGTDYSKAQASRDATELGSEEQEDRQTKIARQAFLSSFSDMDLISSGQLRTTDPYQFRKLVFYASATNFDLIRDFGTEIDSSVGNVEALARAFKAKHEAEEKAKRLEREKQREILQRLLKRHAQTSTEGMSAFIDALPVTDAQKALLRSLLLLSTDGGDGQEDDAQGDGNQGGDEQANDGDDSTVSRDE